MTEIKKITQLGWRRHIMSESGVEGMLYLREKIPTILPGTSDNIIFQAGRSQGFKDCLDAISELLAAEPVKEQRLDND